MKKFEYKLARLSRVRTVQEEIARAQWQGAEMVVRRSLAREQELGNAIAQAIAELGLAQAAPQLNPQHILQARQAIGFMDKQLAAQGRQTRVARIDADRLRVPWQKVRTEVEGLKRLEKKARDSFRVEREREEAKQSDEVAMERARRNNFPLTEERR